MKKSKIINNGRLHRFWLCAIICKFATPKFYIRSINLCFMIFPKSVNKCLVFNGWQRPYICQTNDIRWDMSFKQICI